MRSYLTWATQIERSSGDFRYLNYTFSFDETREMAVKKHQQTIKLFKGGSKTCHSLKIQTKLSPC